jgi:hypothetical protein
VRTEALIAALLTLAMIGRAAADGFKPYPGAVKYTPPVSEQNKQFADAVRPGITITAYLTTDSFDKVVNFYRAIGREHTSASRHTRETLPSGQPIRKTFLILDGAPDLVSSRIWLRIQQPFIGSISHPGGTPVYSDVRPVTEIVLTERGELKK